MKTFFTWFRGIDSAIYSASATMLTVGILALITDLTWCQFPVAFFRMPIDPRQQVVAGVAGWCLTIGVATGLLAAIRLRMTVPKKEEADYSKRMFGRCLVGIGFVFMLDALMNVMAVAGFAKAGALPFLFQPASTNLVAARTAFDASGAANSQSEILDANRNANFKPADFHQFDLASSSANQVKTTQRGNSEGLRKVGLSDSQKNLITGIEILIALGFAVMGALFFFAKSLWGMMGADPPIQFDECIFWAGLWFRLGEAILFTLVVFVALLFSGRREAAGWMPFIALVIGLSVKAAENTIAGLSKRVLDAINGFIG